MSRRASFTSTQARIAAMTLHSQIDSKEHAARASRGAFARFEQQVDPDGTLDPDERFRRAKLAQRVHMSRIVAKRWEKQRHSA